MGRNIPVALKKVLDPRQEIASCLEVLIVEPALMALYIENTAVAFLFMALLSAQCPSIESAFHPIGR